LDRSLIQSGFQDDLIKNKNARVARYVPRAVDGRGKLLDFLGISDSSPSNSVLDADSNESVESVESDQEEENADDSNPVLQAFKSIFGLSKKAIAQNGAPDAGFSATTNQGLLSGSDIGAVDLDITGGVIETNEVIETLTRTHVCFDRITGNRVNNDDFESEAVLLGSNICFDSYICRRQACIDLKTNKEVPAQHLGELKPGVVCETSQDKGYHCYEKATGKSVPILESRITPVGIRCETTNDIVDYSYLGTKECKEISWLLSAQNIKDKQLCFDGNGTLIVDGSFGGENGFCIDPITQTDKVCLDSAGKLHLESEAAPGQQFEICFDPNESFALSLSTQGKVNPNNQALMTEADLATEFFGTYTSLREQAAALHFKLSLIIASAHLFNLHDNGVIDTLKDAANLLLYISQGKLIEEEAFAKIALIIQDLDRILEIIEIIGSVNSQVSDEEFSLVSEIRLVLRILKQIIAGGNNLSWLTVGNRLDQRSYTINGPLGPKSTGPVVDFAQQVLVLTGSLSSESLTGELDLVTQDALEQFQALNGLSVTGVINNETLDLLQDMALNADSLYGNDVVGLINDYISDDEIGFGTYSEDVQTLQIILYVREYDVSVINGILDAETCNALRAFQEDNDLELADENNCIVSVETIDFLNTVIREGSYLGSGFNLHEQGYIEGVGLFKGLFGPGVANFGVNEAEAASLREGEIVLLYSFLDKETILIATHPSIITEVIKRRNLNDIFNQK
ncbi:MAG: peptidoglycan-binding protein, partial [Flavobacteriales bacterium]